MRKLIVELRRREVFRTAGLYVGICWIVIEGASVVLPIFDAPEWILQFLIIAALVGFPVMLVLAWIYDVSAKGIEVQAEATDTVVLPFGDRKGDFIVIGVLAVALIFSVYLNITGSGSQTAETPEPLSILIADFDNRTGDPLFEGSLEQALSIGIEGAPFIAAFSRNAARAQNERLHPEQPALDEAGARLVAVREGVQLVLLGSLSAESERYVFEVRAVDPGSGENRFTVRRRANSKPDVLQTVSEIAAEVRKKLGDTSVEDSDTRGTETFTAATLEAAKAYNDAQALAYSGDYEAAIDLYRAATESDPEFGRAYSGWALAAFNLGRNDEAEQLWQRATALMDSMTDRERYRTLGLYYMAVTRNYPKAIESYEALVSNYPADGAGHNNLAVAYFATLDFERALAEGEAVLDIYPNNLFYQQNYALYAMYAGNFELAEARAKEVLSADASRFYSWLPVAIAELSRGDIAAARESYRRMADIDSGASLAAVGLADIALYEGDRQRALEQLNHGIELDLANDNRRAAATKYIMLAEAQAGLGNVDASMQAINDALAISRGMSRLVPAALLHIVHGHSDAARAIGEELSEALQPERRAYGNMILGVIDLEAGRHVGAIDRLRAALELSDYWLVRFYLGQAYLAAGSHIEAMDEFDICQRRIGEASALFLDDVPTWRYTAELIYYRALASQSAGLLDQATELFQQYLALRRDDNAAVRDARERVTETD